MHMQTTLSSYTLFYDSHLMGEIEVKRLVIPTSRGDFLSENCSAASSTVLMNRTESADTPSQPESPLADSKPAIGTTPSPLVSENGNHDQARAIPSIQVSTAENESYKFDDNHGSSVVDDTFLTSQLQSQSATSLNAISSINLLAGKSDIDLQGCDEEAPVIVESVASNLNRSLTAVKGEWMSVQITTFSNWINDRLKPGKHDRKVNDLAVDLRDGMLLIKLLENLTKKKVKGFTGKIPKTEAHKIDNLNLAFRLMEKEKIKMIGVGGINIYQGNMTLTLGMIWMLIQKYQIRIHGYEVSTKNVMIRWLQAVLPQWKLTNLTTDWKDGRVLLALINKLKPGIVPHVPAALGPSKHKQNCSQAIKIANSYLKIPKIISAEDLSSIGVDELSMMTYLSYFVEPFQVKLLKWVHKYLPQFDISNFSTNWHSGKALGAMINTCFPGAFCDWERLETNTTEEYIDEVMRIAKKKLGITAPFESEDLASGKTEELQIMTMLMLIRSGNLLSLPDEVTVNGPGLEEAHLGKETFFIIDTTEAGPGELSVDALYEEDGRKFNFSLNKKSEQVFCLTYTPPTTGKINFNILWSDVPIPKCPFIVPVIDSTLVKIVDFESHSTLVEVGKPVSLLFDTKQAGCGQLSACLQNEKDKIHATAVTLPDSMFRLEYTPSRAGNAVLNVFWNREKLDHFTISYTVIDIQGYSIASLPKDRVYCTFEEVEFTVHSSNGLPLSVLQMTAILNFDFQIPLKFNSINKSKGYVIFKPTLPGVYNIEVVCANKLVKGTPFSVRVTDPNLCKVQGILPSFLEFKEPYVFEIDTKEAGFGSITFESTDHDNITSLFKTELKPCDSDSRDIQKLEVIPIIEGDFIVGIKYQNFWISKSPFRVQVCDPSKFELVDKIDIANIGKPIEFTIKTRQGSQGDLQPVIKAEGPSAQYSPQVLRSDDGLTYFVKFVPWEIGNHEITIKYGTFHIPSSPIIFPVVAFDTNACSAAGSGLQRAYTNIPAQFVIKSKQSGLLEDGTLKIKVESVIDKIRCKIRARDNKDGTYNIAYLIQKQGAYLVSILVAGEQIPGSPFKLNALPGPKPEKCKVYGPALVEGVVLTFGKPIEFTVDTVEAGMGNLSVKAIGPDGAEARVFIAKTDQHGKYDINIDAIRHGKHRVNVKWSGKHVPSSPFILKIFPGADARKCIAYGPGLEDGLVGKKSFFTIETKNAGAAILRVRLHGVKGAFKIEVKPKDHKDHRTLLANYNPTQPGEYLITIKWSDVHIPGSPFRVKITGKNNVMTPTIFTPTPRLPDATALIEDDYGNEDSDIEDSSVRGLHSAPAVIQSKKQNHVTFEYGIKDRANVRRGSEKLTIFSSLQQQNESSFKNKK